MVINIKSCPPIFNLKASACVIIPRVVDNNKKEFCVRLCKSLSAFIEIKKDLLGVESNLIFLQIGFFL